MISKRANQKWFIVDRDYLSGTQLRALEKADIIFRFNGDSLVYYVNANKCEEVKVKLYDGHYVNVVILKENELEQDELVVRL